jgi:hypothetical protein
MELRFASYYLTGTMLLVSLLSNTVHASFIGLNSANPFAAQTAWEASFTSSTTEDFEGFDLMSGGFIYGDTISTAVGSFAATGAAGEGACATLGNCTDIGVFNEGFSPYLGRYDTSDGDGDDDENHTGQWLDSNDVSQITWTIGLAGGASFNSFGFMLTDPADNEADFTVSLENGSILDTLYFEQTDGLLVYVTGFLSQEVTSATLTLTSSTSGTSDPNSNDGFGIDDFIVGKISDPPEIDGTVVTVPTPSVLALLVAGFFSIGLVRRRRL